MKITRTHNKVLFYTNSGIKTFSQECNVFPHPRNKKQIIIAEVGTPQSESLSFSFDFELLKNYANVPFNPANRDAIIEILAKQYFNTKHRINASQFLDTIGDGAGMQNFNGNYVKLTKAIIKPTGNRSMFISRLLFYIKENKEIVSTKYGADLVLAKGISIRHETQKGNLITDITDGNPIMTNADYTKYGFLMSDIELKNGKKHAHGAWTFTKNGAELELKPDQQLAVYLNDNFSGLLEHFFRAGAYYLE